MYLPFPGFPCSNLTTIKLAFYFFWNSPSKSIARTHANPLESVTSNCKSQWDTYAFAWLRYPRITALCSANIILFLHILLYMTYTCCANQSCRSIAILSPYCLVCKTEKLIQSRWCTVTFLAAYHCPEMFRLGSNYHKDTGYHPNLLELSYSNILWHLFGGLSYSYP